MTMTRESLSPVKRVHGGPDAQGAARWDFSSNSNAVGPCPQVVSALSQVDATRYPDPSYRNLKRALARWHGVDEQRIVLAGSGSEAIARLSAWVAREGGRSAWWPAHSYGDYAHFAGQWRLARTDAIDTADLVWWCNPGSPEGRVVPLPGQPKPSAVVVVDCAYRPLCLEGKVADEADPHGQVWQLWTPNKALGLTGVRGAYLLAPALAHAHVRAQVAALEALAPSWCVGAHAESMLMQWTLSDVQAWLAASLATLRDWKHDLRADLESRGWTVRESDANFFLARPPQAWDAAAARAAQVQLRDATSFGLPGGWRLSAQSPEARAALMQETDRQMHGGHLMKPSMSEAAT